MYEVHQCSAAQERKWSQKPVEQERNTVEQVISLHSAKILPFFKICGKELLPRRENGLVDYEGH